MNDIEKFLNDFFKRENKDISYVSCTQESEKISIKKSNITKKFKEKFNRDFINFDRAFEKTCNELSQIKMKKRKDFYLLLLSKTVNNDDLEINL